MVLAIGGSGGGGCSIGCGDSPPYSPTLSTEQFKEEVLEAPSISNGDGSVSPSSFLVESEKQGKTLEIASRMVSIKEEITDAVDIVEGGDAVNIGGGNGSSSSSSSPSGSVPKPMEELQELGPPPFLKKTFEMVEDPESDPVVSWSETRNSFIVWDSYEFSKILLPKYFKHSNFSSFIRQLNTYGFRKIDTDRWEFANQGFQGGKKHLLKNIKRKSRYNKNQQSSTTSCLDTKKPGGLESELETLKKDHSILKAEILKLRQQEEDSQNQLNVVEERLQCSECKQQQMLSFLIKLAKNPTFTRQLVQKRGLKKELKRGIEFSKRRRLLESLPEEAILEDSINDYETYGFNQTQKFNMVSGLSASQDHNLPLYHFMTEKLMEENSVIGDDDVDDEMSLNDSKFYLELEDLIKKPHDWGGYVTGLVAQGCVGSMP